MASDFELYLAAQRRNGCRRFQLEAACDALGVTSITLTPVAASAASAPVRFEVIENDLFPVETGEQDNELKKG